MIRLVHVTGRREREIARFAVHPGDSDFAQRTALSYSRGRTVRAYPLEPSWNPRTPLFEAHDGAPSGEFTDPRDSQYELTAAQ